MAFVRDERGWPDSHQEPTRWRLAVTDLSTLRESYVALLAGKYAGDLYELVHRFGEDYFVEARPYVESLLAQSDKSLRYIALNVLTLHWGLRDHADTCLK